MSGLIDPQRNLLTTLLVGGIALFGVIGVSQMVLLGRVNVDAIPAVGESGIGDSEVSLPETGLAEIGEYTAITQRPVFFSDRRLPVVEIVEGDDDVDEPEVVFEEEEIEALRAVVAGIIITPDMRLALVRDEAANKTMTLREGMSLEGEQAAWRLDSIAPRTVSFVSVDGRQSELELKINTAGLQAGSPGEIRTPASRRASEADQARREPAEQAPDQAAEQAAERTEATPDETDARARAEEVRRRVAERRAELRAEAERRAQQQRQRQDN
jgi:general secretion pathway protein N